MMAPSAKGQATRERIVRVANDLFHRQGYHATGLEQVLREAGVAKGSFYHHFRNKEALALAVLDWHIERATEELGFSDISSDRSPRQDLIDLIRRILDQRVSCAGDDCRIRGCLFGNFALELSLVSETVRCRVNAIFDRFRDLLAGLIEQGQEMGEIPERFPARQLASMILGLMEGAVLLDKARQELSDSQLAVEFIADYLDCAT